MTQTTITCIKCDSTVPWGPHCPECGAYLEFAGNPPWQPVPPEIAEERAVEETEDATSADAPGDVEVIDESDMVEATTAEVVTDVRVANTVTREQPPQRNYIPSAATVLIGAGVVAGLWWLVGLAIAVAAAVVFLVWAVVLLPRAASASPSGLDTRTPEELITEEVTVGEPESIETVVDDQDRVVMARAPQSLPARAVQSTRPMAARPVVGNLVCESCGQTNEDRRRFCIGCGVALAQVAPSTVPFVNQESPDKAASSTRPRRPRAPGRSWRVPIVVLSLVGVFLASVLFALFGPNAFRVQFGMTQVYQAINQFIDPFAGRTANISNATATSSLRGTDARFGAGGDASNFWASAPGATSGAGEALTVTFEEPTTINRMVILPGIQNGVFEPRAVATPAAITLTFDDGTTAQATLEPVRTEGDLQQLVSFPRVTTRNVVLRIDEVYAPRAWGPARARDPASQSMVAISGLRFLIPPAPPAVFNLPTDVQPRTSLPGTTG